MEIGARIKQRRQEAGLTAVELARRADVSKGYVSELESGQAQRPSGAVLFRISTALGTTVADLMGREVVSAPTEISATLLQFANLVQLPDSDVQMLAQIKFRGRQPASVDDWRYLYESIKRSVTSGES